MNWSTVAGLTASGLILAAAVLRVERKRLWVAIVFLVAPALWLIYQWASFYKRWDEAFLSLGTALLLSSLWWALIGRKLPPPNSDNIKVWGQDAPPKPRPAEMQAEIARLREEKEQLEAELRKLREEPPK